MKIKQDFVTNSSSTAWIVYVPENYSIPINEFISEIKNNYDEDDYENLNIEEVLNEILEDLKNGHTIINSDMEYPIYNTACGFFSRDDLVVDIRNIPQSYDYIIGLKKEKIVEVIWKCMWT